MDVVAVVSNHPDLKPLADWHQIPYYHSPSTPTTNRPRSVKCGRWWKTPARKLVILARYMQVLSPELCRKLDGKAINIHHSLLPGFKGAKPYHQAYNKGVKLVGATAHYINNDLDEGPIIAQGVEVVDHSHYPEDLIAKGRIAIAGTPAPTFDRISRLEPRSNVGAALPAMRSLLTTQKQHLYPST
ncbi:formyl transferase domain-containing protein [Ditylenchus destructor]|nr:formyl transferase domain-containing protein [Ditylenchus destructor]